MKLVKSSQNHKNETLQRLSEAIFSLEASKGHLGWKVTELSRKAKISRSVIYEYLGSSKKEILAAAVTHFIADFYGFDDSTPTMPLIDQVRRARQRMILNPEAILFYQKWRATNSWLQKLFIDVETQFQKKLVKIDPSLTSLQVLMLHSIIHGLVTAPFLTADQAADIFGNIAR